MDYQSFLASKTVLARSTGIALNGHTVHPRLFPFQKDLTEWALRKGRAAIFADTGLGKTGMQLEWARLLSTRSLIIAPLSVARQTIEEAKAIDLNVHYTRSGHDVHDGINITNYEMAVHFEPSAFQAVVLDESSILKALDGQTRARLTAMFAHTPYRLCCTATPAPNDITEIANHAEFLGIMSRADMLASFFVHDDTEWRLKRHAERPFFQWLASWGMSLRVPSDLGYSDDGYILPPLNVEPLYVKSNFVPDGQLFATGLQGIQGRHRARRASLADRVKLAHELIASNNEQWIVWCGLNDEGRALSKLLPDSVLMEGNQRVEEKAQALEGFQERTYRVLITKSKMAGFGMNLQNCHNMIFLGLNDSFEAYYQAIRRCWRFGQQCPVHVKVVISDVEQPVLENVLRKEAEAQRMQEELIKNVQEYERAEIIGVQHGWQYQEGEASGEHWRLLLGDSAERVREIQTETVDLSVFSPPFLSLYTYSPSQRDVGNSRTEEEFFQHFGFIIDELLRVTKPGRLCCVHVSQVPAMLSRDGYIGLKDFRGATITAFTERGWIQHGEVCIDKDPQAQAIRTKSKGLLFVQMHKDASWSRPALADFILVFRKPGENAVPIQPDISNDEWIEWARPIWYGIRESDTLQYHAARSEEDERHIAPLQLGTIERCIRLWSNPGELVLSPFAGIGSEGYMAVKLGRRFVGCELKPEYWQIGVENLKRIEAEHKHGTLFEWAESQGQPS